MQDEDLRAATWAVWVMAGYISRRGGPSGRNRHRSCQVPCARRKECAGGGSGTWLCSSAMAWRRNRGRAVLLTPGIKPGWTRACDRLPMRNAWHRTLLRRYGEQGRLSDKGFHKNDAGAASGASGKAAACVVLRWVIARMTFRRNGGDSWFSGSAREQREATERTRRVCLSILRIQYYTDFVKQRLQSRMQTPASRGSASLRLRAVAPSVLSRHCRGSDGIQNLHQFFHLRKDFSER